jgi:two-component system chemotaxis response regulator CheY
VPSVLVVDDEPDLRYVLRRLLEAAGVEVREAANGRQALSALDEALPDLVVADLAMPVMDGNELVARLRGDTTTARIPIVVWSENPDRSLPVDDFVPKPYAGRGLVERITRLLEAVR